jgi:hypothetical protein
MIHLSRSRILFFTSMGVDLMIGSVMFASEQIQSCDKGESLECRPQFSEAGIYAFNHVTGYELTEEMLIENTLILRVGGKQ